MMSALLLASVVFFVIGGAAALIFAGKYDLCRRLSHGFALCGTALVLVLGIEGLTGESFDFLLPHILPIGGGLALGLDRLSAFFLLIIAAGVLPSTLYAIGYTRHYTDFQAPMGLALNVLIPAMMLVVLSRNVLTFLVSWEAMSLASYFLVMTDSEHTDTRSAGWIYFVMTHAGFACLLIAFLLLSTAAKSMSFSDWLIASPVIDVQTRSVAFALLAIGFGSKAGLIPFHIWLPRAHPAAPSHVSAIMSGVMIKLGIYGLIRTAFGWLGAGPAWWGILVLLVAAVSCVLGVLYALVEHDLKRLLAYHSVENIGIITLGIGAAMLFQVFGVPGLSGLALAAALYHTINHTVFKSLLFMGAGSVLHATQTRNMEEMGGLIRRMPQTAAFFLVGSAAISALPPFNGFVSEWLTFQSLLLSFQIHVQSVNLVFTIAVAALALTSGLAAACFVKAFGIAFLALPRSKRAENAREVDWTMLAPMGFLAVACLALGVAPVLVLRSLSSTVDEFIGVRPDLTFNWNGVAAASAFATISPLWVALILVLLILAVFAGLRAFGANFGRRYYETWGCGRALQTAEFEYTASSFANPFKRVFAFLYRPIEETEIEAHPESRFFVRTITYRHETRSIIEDSIYAPIVAAVQRITAKAHTVQSGNVHSYLLYILVALLMLLLWAK